MQLQEDEELTHWLGNLLLRISAKRETCIFAKRLAHLFSSSSTLEDRRSSYRTWRGRVSQPF